MIIPSIVLAAILSLAQSDPSVQIVIQEGVVDDDVAQTSRSFGDAYASTTACRIDVDMGHFREAEAALRDHKILIPTDKLLAFILLHEMAHCFDGVAAPAGVDSMEWREFMADAYSGSELYASGMIDFYGYNKLIKFRSSLHGAYVRSPLREALASVSHNETGNNSIERIGWAKALRSVVFARGKSSSVSLP